MSRKWLFYQPRIGVIMKMHMNAFELAGFSKEQANELLYTAKKYALIAPVCLEEAICILLHNCSKANVDKIMDIKEELDGE